MIEVFIPVLCMAFAAIFILLASIHNLRVRLKKSSENIEVWCDKYIKCRERESGLDFRLAELQRNMEVNFAEKEAEHASEIQNLHSIYQKSLDEADEKLRLESQEFANEKAKLQLERDRAKLQWKEALEQLSQAQKSHYEDIAVLDRRLKDYDERIRASESARLIAESQMNSIREVCCGK
jgi:chromosome segregation ATPase